MFSGVRDICLSIIEASRRNAWVWIGKKIKLPINTQRTPELGIDYMKFCPSISTPPAFLLSLVLGFLHGDQAGWVRDEVVEVLHLLRPMAVSLVDAW